jgi:hypothetical protein
MNDMELITPTGDRYETLMLTFEYMKRQTFVRNGGLVAWHIVDDGKTDAASRVVAEHSDSEMANHNIVVYHHRLEHNPKYVGPRSLARNISAVLNLITAHKIAIIEDDDCYHEAHLQELSDRLDHSWMAGTVWQRYYHLPSRSYRVFRNRGSAFCSTGFIRPLVRVLSEVCQDCFERNSKGLDARFWQLVQLAGYKVDIYEPSDDTPQVVGMKGLPGREGIGVGHRPKKFLPDPQMTVLKKWVGEDYFPAYRDMLV